MADTSSPKETLQLNLITDKWIPVLYKDGAKGIISPDELVDRNIKSLNFSRLDQNIAGHELLIGMLFLATPPYDTQDLKRGFKMSQADLKEKLEPFIDGFNLLGNGPRFAQDYYFSHHPKEINKSDVTHVDELFFGTAGTQTIKQNKDIHVHRNHYKNLSLPDAAIALYTLQNYASTGGVGYRTSIRGGGPLVMLLDPDTCLWDLLWLNTPFGETGRLSNLPWMRNAVPQKDSEIKQPRKITPEVFFGMPRRIVLMTDDHSVTGLFRKNYGFNYVDWNNHPLTPHGTKDKGKGQYTIKAKSEVSSYRRIFELFLKSTDPKTKTYMPQIISEWNEHMRGDWDDLHIIAAGCVFEQASFANFSMARFPLKTMDEDAQDRLNGLVNSANIVSSAAYQVVKEHVDVSVFYKTFDLKTTDAFEKAYINLMDNRPYAKEWLETLAKVARDTTDEYIKKAVSLKSLDTASNTIKAKKQLEAILSGVKGTEKKLSKGDQLYQALGLEQSHNNDVPFYTPADSLERNWKNMSYEEIIYRWWNFNIQPREEKPRAKALSAILRRENFMKTMGEEEVVLLGNLLKDVPKQRIFDLVSVLANVRENRKESLPRLMKHNVSKTAFQNMQRSSNTQMRSSLRRALQQTYYKCNVGALGRDICHWESPDRAAKWLLEYC